MLQEVNNTSRNWSNYNKHLVSRGSLNFLFDLENIQKWYASNTNNKGKGKGSFKKYSNWAIELIYKVKFYFKLPLRAVTGFIKSFFERLKIKIDVPCYTTLSRRLKNLEVSLSPNIFKESSLDLALDSTGLKVYGEGEWKVRQHGYSKRRTWRKLHIAVDTKNQYIINSVMSSNDFKDNELIEELIDCNIPINNIYADGAYDAKNVYDLAKKKNINPIIPPRKKAKIKFHGNLKEKKYNRDNNIRDIKRNGKKVWKNKNSYHKRSLAETAMFRIKSIFSDKVSSRTFENQAKEIFLKCKILNLFKSEERKL